MKRIGVFVSAVALALATAACGATDAGITTSVKTQFAVDDMVKAHEINVTTRDHVVTLTGEVDTPAAKEQAVRLARNTDGVRDVIDQLRVDSTEATSGIRTDDNDVNDNDVEINLDAAGNAIKKGAEATGDAARDAGRAVRDAVTDDDRDSDNDGK